MLRNLIVGVPKNLKFGIEELASGKDSVPLERFHAKCGVRKGMRCGLLFFEPAGHFVPAWMYCEHEEELGGRF